MESAASREDFKRGAQYDKAWKMAYALRDEYEDLTDEDRLAIVQSLTPHNWDALRALAETKFGKINATKSEAADCTVSHEVKAIVINILATRVRSAKRGDDVFSGL